MDGSRGLEVWRTKKDPQAIRVKMSSIYEYVIKNDTFRILHDFSPFASENIYFESVEVRVVSTGKITLLKIEGYRNPNSISNYTGGGLIPALIDLGLENYIHIFFFSNPYGISPHRLDCRSGHHDPNSELPARDLCSSRTFACGFRLAASEAKHHHLSRQRLKPILSYGKVFPKVFMLNFAVCAFS